LAQLAHQKSNGGKGNFVKRWNFHSKCDTFMLPKYNNHLHRRLKVGTITCSKRIYNAQYLSRGTLF
jgi:hypothetical protein